MTDIVDRLNQGAPSIPAMRDGAEEIMRLRAEVAAAKALAVANADKLNAARRQRTERGMSDWPGRDSARVVAQPSPDYLRGIEDAAGMCDDEVGSAQHFIDKARGQPEAYVERLRLIKECAEGLASSIRGFKDPSVHDTPSEVLNPIRADRDAHEGQAIESDYSAGHAPGVARPKLPSELLLLLSDPLMGPAIKTAVTSLHAHLLHLEGLLREAYGTVQLSPNSLPKTSLLERMDRVLAGSASPVARP